MRITKVKLDNYVCFYDAPEFELGPGINFVVGKNNSGKTALLDAFNLDKPSIPHQSLKTMPERDSIPPGYGTATHWFEFEIEASEVLRLLRGNLIWIPLGNPVEIYGGLVDSFELQRWVHAVLAHNFVFRLSFSSDEAPNYQLSWSNQHLRRRDGSFEAIAVRIDSDSGYKIVSSKPQGQSASMLDHQFEPIATAIKYRIFQFSAERSMSSVAPPIGGPRLDSDASNLAQVVSYIKNDDPHLWTDECLRLMREVVPNVEDIVTPNKQDVETGETVAELRTLPYPSKMRNTKISFSLADCGTGLHDLLAMLYAVVTAEHASIFVIDEPNAFLHPGASKMLLEIFERYPRHQFIVATHSPTAMMSVQKKTILLVEQEGRRDSTVEGVNVDDNAQLEAALAKLGTRRSDIFGMDAVVWVEGKTDESCFKLILDKAGGLPFGTNIMALVNTGDIEGKKHAKLAVDIYRTLSGGVGLLPSALGFVFDGDKQGSHERMELETGAQVKYLPRQNYESYLIVPEILADILRREGADGMKAHSAESVDEWIRENNGERDYDDADWLREVDGAKFLDKLFFCKGGISYENDKVTYGVEITERILERDGSANHFKEIVDILTPLLHPDQSNDEPAQT